MNKLAFLLCLVLAAPLALAATPPALPVEDFVALDDFEEVALSTNGEYLAATVPLSDRTALVVIRLSDMQRVAAVGHGAKRHISDIHWVGPQRIIYKLAEKDQESEIAYTYGELFAVNADGSDPKVLVGMRAGNDRPTGSNIRRGSDQRVDAELIDTLENDPEYVLIQTNKWDGSELHFTQAERMHVESGKRLVVAKAPVRGARFMADHAGVVRFVLGADADNLEKLYHRANGESEWQLVNDEAQTGLEVVPLGFRADNRVAYFQSEQATGPDVILAFDTNDGSSTIVARDDDTDPDQVLYSPTTGVPYGVLFMDGLPRVEYFDASGEDARLHRSLQASFPGQIVEISRVSDGKAKGLLTVNGDRNPGDFYVYDHGTKKASFLLARNGRLDPEQLSARTPVSFKARDGKQLRGYLTLPKGSSGKGLPVVVNPHGGPIGIADVWEFDRNVQLLASRGYAVLQVNFRGSGNHGRDFERAGYRQWGGLMQDDLTDATRWAVAEGIADPARICIIGASYGAYAALMGAAKEPGLYRCAAGHLGVYDLELMYGQGDVSSVRWGRNRLLEILGKERLETVSPSRLADRIAIPVMLTAGTADERAPVAHTERMRDALMRAGKSVETKIYEGEGHGFVLLENEIDFQKRLLDFLARHLQPAPSTP